MKKIYFTILFFGAISMATNYINNELLNKKLADLSSLEFQRTSNSLNKEDISLIFNKKINKKTPILIELETDNFSEKINSINIYSGVIPSSIPVIDLDDQGNIEKTLENEYMLKQNCFC